VVGATGAVTYAWTVKKIGTTVASGSGAVMNYAP
jgi:hypothetical protein